MDGTNLENKHLYALFCRVEVSSVTHSHQSFIIRSSQSSEEMPGAKQKYFNKTLTISGLL